MSDCLGSQSRERRERLKANIPNPIVSQHFSIAKYYDVTSKTLQKFYDAEEREDLDTAYVFAKRYLYLITSVIPEHNYYMSTKYKDERLESHRLMNSVMERLEAIVQIMDVEETQKKEAIKEALEKEKEKERELKREAQKQAEVEDMFFLPSAPTAAPSEIASRGGKAEIKDDDDGGYLMPPPPPPSLPLPPPTSLPPAPIELPPPSYEVATHEAMNHLASMTLEPSAPSPSAPPSQDGPSSPYPVVQPPKKRLPQIPMSQLRQVYLNEWLGLKKSKRAVIYSLDTYQGRVTSHGQNSTNGCTVIAPLIAASHLKSGGGVSDQQCEEVIDQIAGPYLLAIRGKLGLSPNALIIPSDVHDHLVDDNVLKQDWFLGASGGNIMDEEHIGALVSDLNAAEGKKAAAALFFHAHVVCIVKMIVGREVWYDLIDSLPMSHEGGKRGGARIRCKGEDILASCIRWYASSKFGANDVEYIDQNDWDDMNCDFDPRVFQGFVWGQP